MPEPVRAPLVVGSGIAGLYVALRAHELGLRPIVVTKSKLDESNTRYAQGGIAAAIGANDSVERHLADTVASGDGLTEAAMAQILTHEAPERVADLVRRGVPFDTVEGEIALGREAAHSRARILHAGGDATGLAIEETLRARVVEAGIEAREQVVLRALAERPDGLVDVTLSPARGGREERLDGRAVVLATGGAGSLFQFSSNPSIATGDGVAVAYRAGALLTDLEFVQFHPTAFSQSGAPRFLITEAVRGEGALVVNDAGERFLTRYHPAAELAPRDIVSRAIHAEMVRRGVPHVFLDARKIPPERMALRFPTVSRFLGEHGIDPARDRIPVAPVAHYTIGGVSTDAWGRTSIPGLWACGEVAATGVHGANRLASNSLLEGLVFGDRVARNLKLPPRAMARRPLRTVEVALKPGQSLAPRSSRFDEIARWMWDDVGIIRNGPGLALALERLGRMSDDAEPGEGELPSPLAQAALTSRLIAAAAQERTESRGAHFRSDYPKPRAAWRLHLAVRMPRPPPSR